MSVLIYIIAIFILTIFLVVSRYCPYDQKRYILQVRAKVNFFTALQTCRDRGQRLANVLTPGENDCLGGLISDTTFNENRFWISGSDLNNPGVYVWESTGQPVRYTNWYPGQPTHTVSPTGEVQHCIEVLFNPHGYLQWADALCSAQHFFVCED